MPVFGLGTWKSKPNEVYFAVREAIKLGYRHIDCSPIYGNEPEVGEAISSLIKEKVIRREELWITSKLWNNAHRKENVLPALKSSLKALQIDYLDLFLIHWPVVLKNEILYPKTPDELISLNEVPISDTWQMMEKSVEQGLTKHIGVSNFSIKKLDHLYNNCSIKPEANQIELHPFLQQNKMLEYCNKNNINLTAYSPLASGDRPDAIKADNELPLLDNDLILEIAKKNKLSPAQVLISWAINRGTTVIPKSINPSRLANNLEAANVELNQSDMDKILKLDKNFRYITGKFWAMEGSAYSLENLWDE